MADRPLPEFIQLVTPQKEAFTIPLSTLEHTFTVGSSGKLVGLPYLALFPTIPTYAINIPQKGKDSLPILSKLQLIRSV